MKFKHKIHDETVEAITFQELVAHGIAVGGNIVNGMPWSFAYLGHPISHENDECYIIPTRSYSSQMTPDRMLVTNPCGHLSVAEKDRFHAEYTPVLPPEKVTPDQITNQIEHTYFFTADRATQGCPQVPSLSLLTFCILVLKNGYTVTGQSACADPNTFDAQQGRQYAYDDARDKIWPLLGYQLKEWLHQAEQGAS